MTTREMHYDFKIKSNKLDSQQNRNFTIPEIDWFLNEGTDFFVKKIVAPRIRANTGFEINQRAIDDVRTLVVDNECFPVPEGNYVVDLMPEYLFYISGTVIMNKGKCSDVVGTLKIQQHDDLFETSPFDKSSFEWREVNATFVKDGIRIFTDGTFTCTSACIKYVKKPKYIHNAQDFEGGSYTHPSGTVLTGTRDSELPEHVHREIVDIAVMLASTSLSSPDYQIKMQKLNFNGL